MSNDRIIERCATNDSARTVSLARRWAWRAAAAMTLLAVTPWQAHAQFGMLRKLKKAVSAPDSSARATDSLAQLAAGVKPESVKVGPGLLARGVAAGKSANSKMEAATGISAKDAALMASGVGAGNVIAKKMGVDPMSLGKAALANSRMKSEQHAMQAANGSLGVNLSGLAGMSGMSSMAQLKQMQSTITQAGASRKTQQAATGAPTTSAAMVSAAMAGVTQADAEALVAFQQEMMQVAMAASAGDATAKARLDAWQALTMKHEGEIQKLSIAAQGGDAGAVQKLQLMQVTIMKEWASTAGAKSKLTKGAHK
jgi:hypothetical protein